MGSQGFGGRSGYPARRVYRQFWRESRTHTRVPLDGPRHRRGKSDPVKGAKVVVHPYKAFTDERGVAEVRVPKGEYRLVVSGTNYLAISEFPKWRKYLILLSFLDNSSARPVQIGSVDVNICHSRSTAVRGRRRSSSQSPPRGPFCRTRTGPVEADGAVDAQNAPTAPWKTLCVFHELPQGLSHQVTHEKLRKAPKYRWETRIDPIISPSAVTAK